MLNVETEQVLSEHCKNVLSEQNVPWYPAVKCVREKKFYINWISKSISYFKIWNITFVTVQESCYIKIIICFAQVKFDFYRNSSLLTLYPQFLQNLEQEQHWYWLKHQFQYSPDLQERDCWKKLSYVEILRKYSWYLAHLDLNLKKNYNQK